MTDARGSVEERVRRAGGDELVFDSLAAGQTVQDVADKVGCSPRSLHRWRLVEGTGRAAAWTEAIQVSAASSADEADAVTRSVLSDVEAVHRGEREHVAAAKLRANQLRWRAAKLDPERYGDKGVQVGVALSVGSLFSEVLSAGPEHAALRRDRRTVAIEAKDARETLPEPQRRLPRVHVSPPGSVVGSEGG